MFVLLRHTAGLISTFYKIHVNLLLVNILTFQIKMNFKIFIFNNCGRWQIVLFLMNRRCGFYLEGAWLWRLRDPRMRTNYWRYSEENYERVLTILQDDTSPLPFIFENQFQRIYFLFLLDGRDVIRFNLILIESRN